MTVTLPGHVPWVVHRVAVSGHYHDALHTILTAWSLADVCDAYEVCDALDEARAEAERAPR